jgi:transposase
VILREEDQGLKGWDEVIEIKKLIKEGRSISEVARRLKMDRKTVRKYRDRPVGEIAEGFCKARQRSRKIDRYQEWIQSRVEAMAEDGVINAQAMLHDLRALGYRGSARTLRRYVGRLRVKHQKKRRIYEPFETAPGQQAMVDLGEKRKLRISGRRQPVYFVAMVLSYSRKKYAEWYDRPIDTQTFIEFHHRAFQYFEGIPRQVVYDQSKLAVLSEQYGEVEFNTDFYGCAQWCGFEPYICRKFDPETKGKIESVIRYAKRGFLPGRSFDNLADLSNQWQRWLNEVADAKPHETTRRVPQQVWEQEKPHLQPLARTPFRARPVFRTQQVYDDGFVKVLGNRYSVPASHHGREVKVRVSEEKVEIRSLQDDLLYTHWRSLEKGKRFKVNAHYEKQYQVPTEQLTAELLSLYESLQLSEQLKKNFPRHYREQCRQIIALGKQYDRQILKQAVRRLIEHGCVSYKNLRVTARYLESRQTLSKTFNSHVDRDAQLPPDLGLEARPSDYYDCFLEVES